MRFGKYTQGGIKKKGNEVTNPKEVNWDSEMEQKDVFLILARNFYNLLSSGEIIMEYIDFLIFDEVNIVSTENHMYCNIIRDFYFNNNVVTNKRPLPQIIGFYNLN